ncbi:MAG: FAD/NAD(P)-binding protein [Nanoarchaeota archaeon]|nr:FAD/NAD(P)-binding protein [Nanoarchaeota archaeon]
MAKDNIYVPTPAKIIDYVIESGDTFSIKLDVKMEHDPGQFVMCSIPGIGESAISICSFSRDYLELNIREVGNVTNAISRLKKDDSLLIRGPYGHGYPMDDFKDNSIVIIGGGSGVAPLKGIIEYVDTRRSDFKYIDIFIGYRTPEDILFKKQLKSWKTNHKVHLSVDKNPNKTKFDGKVGFVTELLKQSDFDNKGRIAVICGPPIMIKFVVGILKDKGFNEDQIFVSAERMMQCGVGFCGHCMINGKYCCKDGPVFRYDEIKDLPEK